MLLKQLDYFIKVVEYRSFTKAAAAAYISQSAISQQIQALENSLGSNSWNATTVPFL
ncbi:LysR family transcriptional regulator [Limosilactobacillus fermentum]|nr:LysR family transcriptional regulator [Limosilactobacillus fermentum]